LAICCVADWQSADRSIAPQVANLRYVFLGGPETSDRVRAGVESGLGGATVFPLTDAGSGKRLNHPANPAAVYAFAAELLGESLGRLAERVEENFLGLFGGLGRGTD
jgi:hypothetical protein